MRKLLLLALTAACLAFAGCDKKDKEDNTIRYDEFKGYLTNLASAKHGIVGKWCMLGECYTHNADGTVCVTYGSDPDNPECHISYELYEKDGKIMINERNSTQPGKVYESEIISLTKTYFEYKSSSSGETYWFLRKPEDAPTP